MVEANTIVVDAFAALKNDEVKPPVSIAVSQSIIQEDKTASDSYTSAEVGETLAKPVFDYDREAFLASLPKKKKKHWITNPKPILPSYSKPSDSSRKSSSTISADPTRSLLGSMPTNAYDVGMSMPHRILFLSSHSEAERDPEDLGLLRSTRSRGEDYDPDELGMGLDHMRPEEEEDQMALGLRINDEGVWSSRADDWGFESSQEMSMLYRAGDAISVHADTADDDDEDGRSIVDMADSNNQSQKHGEDSLWTSADVQRHRRIANTIIDWLRMLSSCGYISSIRQGDR
jgi:hypothetical protein